MLKQRNKHVHLIISWRKNIVNVNSNAPIKYTYSSLKPEGHRQKEKEYLKHILLNASFMVKINGYVPAIHLI